MTDLALTDEEWETYFRLRAQADDYLNYRIRLKRAEQYEQHEKKKAGTSQAEDTLS